MNCKTLHDWGRLVRNSGRRGIGVKPDCLSNLNLNAAGRVGEAIGRAERAAAEQARKTGRWEITGKPPYLAGSVDVSVRGMIVDQVQLDPMLQERFCAGKHE